MSNRINQYQASFVSGLLSPLVLGRTDIDKYKSGCQTAINVVIMPFGSITRRPGFKFIAALEDQTKVGRLIEFEYSNIQAYIIELTNLKIRFYRNQGILLQGRDITNGTFTSGITGWTSTSSGTGAISHDAGNLRLTLTGGGAANEARATSTVLPNYGTNTYNVTLDVFTSSTIYKVGTTSGGSGIATGTLTTGLAKTFSFTPTTNGDVYITFENAATSSIDNVAIALTTIYEIDSPYTEAQIPDLDYDQSFDALYITHPSHKPYKLMRNSADNWTLSAVTFLEPAWQDENATSITMTPSALTGSVTFTASSSTFASTDVGRGIRFKSGVDKSLQVQYPGTGSQEYFDITFYPQTSSTVEVFIVDVNGLYTEQTYNASPGAGEFNVVNGQVVLGSTASANESVVIRPKYAGSGKWGWGTITAYTSATQVTVLLVNDVAGINASTYWRLGAWSATTGYPAHIAFHDQRLWLANNTTQPETIWGSRTADFENFQPDSDELKGVPEASSSVTYSLNTPSIQFIVGLRELIVGCKNGIIPIIGQSGAIEATSSPKARLDGNYKCAAKKVIKTADEILFIEDLLKRVDSAAYSYEKDGFKVNELTLLADNITATSGVKGMAYAETPYRVLWLHKNDGTIASCTFKADQNLTAWATHTIGGTGVEVESMAVIPGATYSEVWAIIKRTINGGTKRYVEVMQPFFYNQAKSEAFYVDSGLIYSGSPATIISGLSHLEGQTVTILADGTAMPTEVVSSGSITLDEPASYVIVGLGYNSDFSPVYQEGGSKLGATQMSLAKTTSLGIRLFETINLQIGSTVSTLSTLPFRTGSDPMDSSPPLFTGDKVVDFDDDVDLNYTVYIRQNLPYPMTVLSLLFKTVVND